MSAFLEGMPLSRSDSSRLYPHGLDVWCLVLFFSKGGSTSSPNLQCSIPWASESSKCWLSLAKTLPHLCTLSFIVFPYTFSRQTKLVTFVLTFIYIVIVSNKLPFPFITTNCLGPQTQEASKWLYPWFIYMCNAQTIHLATILSPHSSIFLQIQVLYLFWAKCMSAKSVCLASLLPNRNVWQWALKLSKTCNKAH